MEDNTMKHSIFAGLALALAGPLISADVQAGPDDYMRTPIVEEGEKEIDLKWGTQDNRDGTSSYATALGLGWGVTSRWFTEFYGKYKGGTGQSGYLAAWEVENRFQLTETGQFPVDVGFLLEMERPEDRAEGYEFVYGPMLQSEWGRIQGNLNLFLKKHVKTDLPFDTELKYQMQIKYRQSEKFEWGAQAYGELGQWNDWSQRSSQVHKFGPAVFGKFKTTGRQAIKWNAAILRGTTNASPSTTFRLQAEYEF